MPRRLIAVILFLVIALCAGCAGPTPSRLSTPPSGMSSPSRSETPFASPSLPVGTCLAAAGAACAGATDLIVAPGTTDLSGINLAGATLTNLALARTNLRGANLDGAALSGDFSGSDFSGASAQNTTLSGTFSGADFSGADLFGLAISGTLVKVDFAGANLSDAALSGDLTGASFANAHLDAALFRDANLRGANFIGVSRRAIITFYRTSVICPDGARSNPRYADLRACRI